MYDANLILQSLTTLVSASLNSTAVDLKTGTPRRGLKARYIVESVVAAATGAVITPSIEHSDDNTTYKTLASGTPITVATASTSMVIFIPFETSKRYVRLATSMSVTTGTPTIVFHSDLGVARP